MIERSSKVVVLAEEDRIVSPAGLTRSGERELSRFSNSHGELRCELLNTIEDASLQGCLTEIQGGGGPVLVHSHDGVELVFVLSGKLRIDTGAVDITLGAGDSFYFDSSRSHSYTGLGSDSTRFVVVTTTGQPQRINRVARRTKKCD